MSEECKGCNSSGLYLLACTKCCLRLIESTPKHGARAAMWAHLQRSLSSEQWEVVRERWRNEARGEG